MIDRKVVAVVAIPVLLLSFACERYQHKPLPMMMPSDMPNVTEIFGAQVAARTFGDREAARQVFGFDIVGAKILPVQVIFDHRGYDPLYINPQQTFLKDENGNLWNILDESAAYDRIDKVTDWGEVAPKAGKNAVLGAAAGAIIGAAIAVVSGHSSMSEYMGAGAAVGAAGGAVMGGAEGLEDRDVQNAVRRDLRTRSLENRDIPPQGLSQGILFFPGEAVGVRSLRLQVENRTTREIVSVDLFF